MPAGLESTIDAAVGASRAWDVIVVGAGPTGSVAAWALAARGRRVLLLDKSEFPRSKVCGCCLSAGALAALRSIGAPDPVAPTLTRVRVHAGNLRAELPIPAGAAVCRSDLDAMLARHAVGAGAAFLCGASASLACSEPRACRVTVRKGGATFELRAAAVVAADGIAGRFLADDPRFATLGRTNARIGCAAIVDEGTGFEAGMIYMACAPEGYVGLVRLGDGRLNIAGALDPRAVRALGGPGAAASAVIGSTGLRAPAMLESARWSATPGLTRRRASLHAGGVFVIGDAAGYVEPFTGEGMAWGMLSALACAPLIDGAVHGRVAPGAWERVHRRLVGGRHRVCAAVSAVLRRPALTRGALRAIGAFPGVGARVADWIGRGPGVAA